MVGKGVVVVMADNKETILWENKQNTSWTILALTEYKGVKYLQLRVMWRRNEEIGDDSTWKFSKKVISFDFEIFMLFLNSFEEDWETIKDKITTHLES